MLFRSYHFFLIVVFCTLSLALVNSGNVLLTGFVVDAIHALLVVDQLSLGLELHSDIRTPLGFLAFAPIWALREIGFPAGPALALSNALVTLFFLPMILWVGLSRFDKMLAFIFGGLMLFLGLTMLHGDIKSGVDMSMYYNRWCWIGASVLLVIIFLDVKEDYQPNANFWDGAIIGITGAALVFTKMTFAAVLGPLILIALLMRARFRALLWAFFFFVLMGGIVLQMLGGMEFALRYFTDLWEVSRSVTRDFPSMTLSEIAMGPTGFLSTATLFAALVILRRLGLKTEGSLLLFAGPALYYITYQNWGNDPFWIIAMSLILWQISRTHRLKLAPFSPQILALVMAAPLVPVIVAMAMSAPIHLALKGDEMSIVSERHPSLRILPKRIENIVTTERYFADPEDAPKTAIYGGITFDDCAVTKGDMGQYKRIVDDLQSQSYLIDQPVLVADLVQYIPWFMQTEFVRGMSPWFYGHPEHLLNGKFVVVPHCVSLVHSRGQVLDSLDEIGFTPKLRYQSDLLAVFELQSAG